MSILESLNLGLEQSLWEDKGCKHHEYKLLPSIKDVLICREPLRVLADTFWEFVLAKGVLMKQQQKLQAGQKELNHKERISKSAQKRVDVDAQKMLRLAREASAEEATADAEEKRAATAKEAAAAEAFANRPPPGVKVFKCGTEESLTAGTAARAAAHAAGVKVKWKVEQRSAEIAHEQSTAAFQRGSNEAAVAKEAVAAEGHAEKHAAFVARAAETQYCSAWLIAMEGRQLSHALEALIAKWFSEMLSPREVLWKLLHDDVRFCYGPGLQGAEEELLQCIRERLEQLGMSSTAKLDFRMSRSFAGTGDSSNVVVVNGPGDLLADVRRLINNGVQELVIKGVAASVETSGQTDERAVAFLRRANLE